MRKLRTGALLKPIQDNRPPFTLDRKSFTENKLRDLISNLFTESSSLEKNFSDSKSKTIVIVFNGEADSIDHSFINCRFTLSFYQKVLQWFNTTYNSTFRLTTEEFLFGIPTACTKFCKKINYTIMFLRYYIYKRKLQNDSLLLPDLTYNG